MLVVNMFCSLVIVRGFVQVFVLFTKIIRSCQFLGTSGNDCDGRGCYVRSAKAEQEGALFPSVRLNAIVLLGILP